MFRNDTIRLVGPGGAGKSTVGLALARRLGIAFVDLDEWFRVSAGVISAYLDGQGYSAYAAQNVREYIEMRASLTEAAVMALSSGFMTYSLDVHPTYPELYVEIASSPTTFVLLPSLDYEECVCETVRRQLMRPFSRSAEREEEIIRQRFGVYRWLPARHVETLMSVNAVVDNLLAHLRQMPSDPRPMRTEPSHD